jgi:hypothetical protein
MRHGEDPNYHKPKGHNGTQLTTTTIYGRESTSTPLSTLDEEAAGVGSKKYGKLAMWKGAERKGRM